jgi:hypothetical protein
MSHPVRRHGNGDAFTALPDRLFAMHDAMSFMIKSQDGACVAGIAVAVPILRFNDVAALI